jgi:hypothetical protein
VTTGQVSVFILGSLSVPTHCGATVACLTLFYYACFLFVTNDALHRKFLFRSGPSLPSWNNYREEDWWQIWSDINCYEISPLWITGGEQMWSRREATTRCPNA